MSIEPKTPSSERRRTTHARSWRSANDSRRSFRSDTRPRRAPHASWPGPWCYSSPVPLRQVQRGQIAPADREHLRAWLARFAGRDDVAFAVEGCTGWRYVAEELAAAGAAAHLAEPADTAFARGRKRPAKTDCRHLRELLAEGRPPECWIPPGRILECRALLELYHDLRAEHTAWVQRIHAVLFHQGAPGPGRGRSSDRAGPGRAAGGLGRLPVTGRAAAGGHRPGGDRGAGRSRLRPVMVFVRPCCLITEDATVSFIAVRVSLGADRAIRPSEAQDAVLPSE